MASHTAQFCYSVNPRGRSPEFNTIPNFQVKLRGEKVGGGGEGRRETNLISFCVTMIYSFLQFQVIPFNATFLIILKIDSENETALTYWDLMTG